MLKRSAPSAKLSTLNPGLGGNRQMAATITTNDFRSRWKQRTLHAARSLGLLDRMERAYRAASIAKGDPDNDLFCREYPDFVPPPKAAMHDAYGTISFRSYWQSGEHFAGLIAETVLAHHRSPRRALEWGCGPARIIRHLPNLLPRETQLFGSDYNSESVVWCAANFPKISFVQNELTPPLPFERRYFDVVYAVSVFTHLSIQQQKVWAIELRRLLADDGILIFTTNGERAAHLLLAEERVRFEKEGVVTRDRDKEGSRCYLSYHRPDYVSGNLFPDLTVLKHTPGYAGAPGTEQDIWILGAKPIA